MNIDKLQSAVVIGGSMAGLLAARTLSDFCREVIVVERDETSQLGVYRRGVPQGRHAHAILAGGLEVIEELFPGLSEELVAQGALECDALNDGRWFFEGANLVGFRSGIRSLLMSRPLLEDGVRRRVRRIDGIRMLDSTTVRELQTDGDRVTGVRTDVETIEADLVVDASGRGSRAPLWLESLGYDAPREDKVGVQLAYTTRVFRREPHHMSGDAFVLVPPTPNGKRGGVALAKENNEWIVTLFGHFGHRAPEDLQGFIEYARSLPAPHVYHLVREADPVGNARTMQYPASIRHRYEELDDTPEGFLVFGDAVCSFNPIYGQGMSSAALQCRELKQALQNGRQDLARRFYKAAAKVIDNPWSIAVGSDLKMSETTGHRGLDTKIINWYIGKLHERGHVHTDAAVAFTRVAQLLAPPSTLLRPSLAARVIATLFSKRLALAAGSRRDAIMTTAEPRRDAHTSGF